MGEAGAASTGVGVDGVLATVGDDVNLSLATWNLGLGHNLAFLVHGVEIALSISGIEDGVVKVILLLTAHSSDCRLRDLAGKGFDSILEIDSRQFPIYLSN